MEPWVKPGMQPLPWAQGDHNVCRRNAYVSFSSTKSVDSTWPHIMEPFQFTGMKDDTSDNATTTFPSYSNKERPLKYMKRENLKYLQIEICSQVKK